MIHTEVSVLGDALDEARALLSHMDRGAERAMVHALNRTIVGARADIVRALPQMYRVKAGSVREAIKLKNARVTDLSAAVHSRGSVIELFAFTHSPKSYSLPRPKIGVRVSVRKDRPSRRIAGAFLVPGEPHIFRRLADDSRSFRRLYGPAIPSMMRVALDEEGEQGIQTKAEERLVREVQQNVDYLLNHGQEYMEKRAHR